MASIFILSQAAAGLRVGTAGILPASLIPFSNLPQLYLSLPKKTSKLQAQQPFFLKQPPFLVDAFANAWQTD
ncbi:MAG: hypothetical protein LLF76_11105 [Planctomycetaceae bacterium]|nr:hypothetical protein [Planctomycetaceae bacterium]